MDPGFSAHVATLEWRTEASRWALECIASAGLDVIGKFQQVRIRPWSTQATIATTAGPVWFKANHPAMRFEAALHGVWADVAPDSVDRPVAVDVDRGWLLTRDRGSTMAGRGPHSDHEGAWCDIVNHAAHLQRVALDHRDALLGTGLTDCSPGRVPEHFDHLLESLDDEFARRLRDRRGDLLEACELLAHSSIPVTWQHGDLHLDNVFDTVDGPRIFDFGDSQWAHAVEILAVPYAMVHEDAEVRWDAVVEAWLEPWGASRRDFDEAWNAVAFVHPVNRALVWHRALVGAGAADLADWGTAVVDHLGRILDA